MSKGKREGGGVVVVVGLVGTLTLIFVLNHASRRIFSLITCHVKRRQNISNFTLFFDATRTTRRQHVLTLHFLLNLWIYDICKHFFCNYINNLGKYLIFLTEFMRTIRTYANIFSYPITVTFCTCPRIQRRPWIKQNDIASRPISHHTKMTILIKTALLVYLIKPALLVHFCAARCFKVSQCWSYFFVKSVHRFVFLKVQWNFAFLLYFASNHNSKISPSFQTSYKWR